MSETYTTGGDKTIAVPNTHWAGQTFQPLEEHLLQYIDLDLRLWGVLPQPFVGIWLANPSHEPVGDYLSRNRSWLIDFSLSPKDWTWYEPWGKTINENHYWIPQPPPNPPTLTLNNSKLTIEQTGIPAQWIATLLSTTFIPLVDPDTKHLYFHHHSPVSTGHIQHHWHSYTFITHKAAETWYLEAVISHGTDWPPFNGAYRPTPLGAAFYVGQGPSIFDFTQHWINARTALALNPDPTGWNLTHLQLRIEDTASTPGGTLTNTYTGLARQAHQPPPQNDYPIGKAGYDYPGKVYRVRFPMQPLTVLPDNYYAILLTSSPAFLQIRPSWRYDSDDATYPRGRRIFSDDSKATWTSYPNDDHIFAEFGNPPLPKPDPPPPIAHIAPLGIFYTPNATDISVTLHTSVPCHLSLYHTDKKPLQHDLSRVVRGVSLPWSSYFCFVAWYEVEQIEPGDTLYHTFAISPWQYCQTKWFTFRGNIAHELSPSVGPIFKKHHPGALTSLSLPPWYKAYYRSFRSANPGDPDVIYTLAHDQEKADSYHTGVLLYGQRLRRVGTYAGAMVRRLALHFNTQGIAPATLISATLQLLIRKLGPPSGYSANWDWHVKIRAGLDLNNALTHPELINYSKILALGTEIASKYADDLPDPAVIEYWNITVPLSFINLNGLTVFTSLTSNDESATRPANNTVEEPLFVNNAHARLHINYYKH